MEFEWDPRKATRDLRKHGVDFADAVIALEDDNALTIADPGHDELRFKTPGMGPTLDVLFVVHSERSDNKVRIISARRADKKESSDFFRGLRDE